MVKATWRVGTTREVRYFHTEEQADLYIKSLKPHQLLVKNRRLDSENTQLNDSPAR